MKLFVRTIEIRVLTVKLFEKPLETFAFSIQWQLCESLARARTCTVIHSTPPVCLAPRQWGDECLDDLGRDLIVLGHDDNSLT